MPLTGHMHRIAHMLTSLLIDPLFQERHGTWVEELEHKPSVRPLDKTEAPLPLCVFFWRNLSPSLSFAVRPVSRRALGMAGFSGCKFLYCGGAKCCAIAPQHRKGSMCRPSCRFRGVYAVRVPTLR